jgi:hypothetical protein
MGRPTIDLGLHREWLQNRYQSGTPMNVLCNTLADKYNISIVPKTLSRRLQQWGISRNQIRTHTTDELQQRLRELFFEFGLSDAQLLERLRSENYSVSLRGIQSIRLGLQIYRRRSPEELANRLREIHDFFEYERRTENLVRMMGREALSVHLRQRGFNLPRDPLFQVYATDFHSKEVEARRNRMNRKRGGWTAPGPNYFWCVDAYLKLQRFGFEIYAAIDAYSRFIPWFFVGYSALTARSIVIQYLEIIGELEYIPLAIRSDRGGELHHFATVHYLLSQAAGNRRHPRVYQAYTQDIPNAHSYPQNFPRPSTTEVLSFGDCWCFGKSIHNQKIESWWSRLCSGRSIFWRVSRYLMKSHEIQ